MKLRLLLAFLLTSILLCEGIVQLVNIHQLEEVLVDISIEGEEEKEKDIEEKTKKDSKIKTTTSSAPNHLDEDVALNAFEYGHPIYCFHLDVITPPPKGDSNIA